MVIDRLTKLFLGVLAAAAIAIGASTLYLAFAPTAVDAKEDLTVNSIGACNAYLDPETKPWCAEVLSLDGGDVYALATDW
jgi:hypothetical protein